MKKWLLLLLVLPTIVCAAVNPPWEAFKGPYDKWSTGKRLSRMSVPHGWMVYSFGENVIFIPDENHEWVLDASLTRPCAEDNCVGEGK